MGKNVNSIRSHTIEFRFHIKNVYMEALLVAHFVEKDHGHMKVFVTETI